MNSYYEKFIQTGEVKCIDNEIPFEVPEGWEWERIGNVFETRSGSTPLSRNPDYYKNGIINWVRTTDLNNGALTETDIKITQKAYEDCHLTILPHNSVCMAMYGGGGTIGKHCIIKFDTTINQSVCAIIPNSICNMDYFHLFIEYQRSYWMDFASGSRKDPNINQIIVKRCLFPIPPIAEQYRIVAKIKKLRPLIDKYDDSHTELDTLNTEINNKLRKSILQEAIRGKLVTQIEEEGDADMLLTQIKEEKKRLTKEGKLKKSTFSDSIIFKGDDNMYYEQIGKKIVSIDEEIPFEIPTYWTWTRLSNIALSYTGNSINEAEKRTRYTHVQGREYIGTKDIDFNSSIRYNNDVSIPNKFEDRFKIAPANSVLMCIEGGSAGRKIGIIDRDVCFGNKLCCFVPFIDISKYILYYLQSPAFFEMFNARKTGIIGGVSVNNVKQMLIPIPPLSEIRRIIDKVADFKKYE